MKLKLKTARPRRNGKLAQKANRRRDRIKEKVFYPIAGRKSRLRDQWRVALKERNQEEREAINVKAYAISPPRGNAGWTGRIEEREALMMLKDVSTIWAILERNNPLYRRPVWADHRFGSR